MSDPHTAPRRRKYVGVLLCLVVGAGVAAAGIVGSRLLEGRPDGPETLMLVIAVAILVAFLVAVIVLARTGALLHGSPSMPAAQRRAVSRALHRRGPVAPEDRTAAVETARGIVRNGWSVWLVLGVAVLIGLPGVVDAGRVDWIRLSFAVIGLSVAAYYAWIVRRARAIIAEFGA